MEETRVVHDRNLWLASRLAWAWGEAKAWEAWEGVAMSDNASRAVCDWFMTSHAEVLTDILARPAERAKLVASFENVDLGVRADVTKRADGRYAVTVVDTDAGEVLPSARIWDDAETALSYAAVCADSTVILSNREETRDWLESTRAVEG